MNKSFRLFQKVNIFKEEKSSKSGLISTGILAINLPLLGSTLYLILHPQFSFGWEIFSIIFLTTIAGFLLLQKEISQIEQSIVRAIHALNSYFELGEVLELNSSHYYEIDKLFKAIEYSIQKSEERNMDLENMIGYQQEGFDQIYIERETAESHLRQCLGIASRHHLPLCIALVRIENIDLIKNPENSDDLTHLSPAIMALIQKLQQLLRESDWVVHWGNQEFLLAVFSELAGTQLVLNRILTNLFISEEPSQNSPQYPIYIGFTMAQPNEHYRACLERTNQALEKAKTTGEHCIYL